MSQQFWEAKILNGNLKGDIDGRIGIMGNASPSPTISSPPVLSRLVHAPMLSDAIFVLTEATTVV